MSQIEPTQPPPPPTLDYGHRSRLDWIGRHRKKLILVAICIAIAIPIGWYWQALKLRIEWLYWTRQAVAFQMPAQSMPVAYRGSKQARAIVANDPDFVLDTSLDVECAVYAPPVLRRLSALDQSFVKNGHDFRALAFMGTLRRPDGTPRLVVITRPTRGGTTSPLNLINVGVLAVPAMTHRLPPAVARMSHAQVTSGFIQGSYELNSGRRDPNDPTHVIFDFDVVGWGPIGDERRQVQAHGQVDAYLLNDDGMRFTMLPWNGPSIHWSGTLDANTPIEQFQMHPVRVTPSPTTGAAPLPAPVKAPMGRPSR